jgi:hypothetical protein
LPEEMKEHVREMINKRRSGIATPEEEKKNK